MACLLVLELLSDAPDAMRMTDAITGVGAAMPATDATGCGRRLWCWCCCCLSFCSCSWRCSWSRRLSSSSSFLAACRCDANLFSISSGSKTASHVTGPAIAGTTDALSLPSLSLPTSAACLHMLARLSTRLDAASCVEMSTAMCCGGGEAMAVAGHVA